MLGVSIEYSIHPTNRVYHALTPQPRSFLRELPTLGETMTPLNELVIFIELLIYVSIAV